MIDKATVLAMIDQQAAEFRNDKFTTEEIATLAVCAGLEWAALVLQQSMTMDVAQRQRVAEQMLALKVDLIGRDDDSE
jgi:hypothetical protein